MSVSDVLHWLIDHTTRDGSTAPEKVAELHEAVDAAGQVDEPAPPPEPAQPDPEPTPDPEPAPTVPDPAEVTPDAQADA